MAEGGIYQIRNKTNNKIYIGSTKDFHRRETGHFNKLRCNSHANVHLQNSYNKYGECSFIFDVLEVLTDKSKESLIAREQWYLDNWSPDYNIARLASGGCGKGKSWGDVTRQKISAYWTSDRRAKSREKMLGKKNPMWGKTHSQSVIAKIKASHGWKGRKHKESTKRKMSASARGHRVSLESRRKTGKGNKGRPRTNYENELKRELSILNYPKIKQDYYINGKLAQEIADEREVGLGIVHRAIHHKYKDYEISYLNENGLDTFDGHELTSVDFSDRFRRIPLKKYPTIKLQYSTGNYTQKALAKEYKVAPTTIHGVIHHVYTDEEVDYLLDKGLI